jgi:hypothetical protein
VLLRLLLLLLLLLLLTLTDEVAAAGRANSAGGRCRVSSGVLRVGGVALCRCVHF